MSDAPNPRSTATGQYLYFTASTNFGPTSSGLDMTSDEHDVTRSVYLAVLPEEHPSPLAPESDEESRRLKPPQAKRRMPTTGTAGGGRGGPRAVGVEAAAANTPAPTRAHRFDDCPSASSLCPFPPPGPINRSPPAARASSILVESAGAGGRAPGGAARRSSGSISRPVSRTLSPRASPPSISPPTAKKCCLRMGGGAGGRRPWRTRRSRTGRSAVCHRIGHRPRQSR